MATIDRRSLRRLLLTHETTFLFLVGVAGALGAVSGYFWQQSSAESIRLNHISHVASEIRADLYRQLNEVALARLREDPAAESVHQAYAKRIKENFNVLRRRSETRDEGYAIQALQQSYGFLRAEMNIIFEDPFLANRLVRSKLLDPGYQAGIMSDFEQAFANLRGLLSQKLDDQEQRIAKWTKIAPYVIPIPLVFATILLIISRRSLQYGFVRPIQQIVARLRAQNSDEPLPEVGVSEVAELARGINQMNQALAESHEALVEKERQAALGALVPVVAHNIRNPLASIRASAQVLEHNDSASELAETKGDIIDTVDRLGRWVNALVSYLHPLTPQYKVVPAAILFDETIRLLRNRCEDSNIEIVRDPWDETINVSVDVDLMEQALYAVISNAIDASQGGDKIRLGIENNDGQIELSVADEGGGMPFTPEPKGLEPGPTTKRLGTGLGIPIAFKVCNAHGWELEFDIDAGIGTCVKFVAPRSNSPDNSDVVSNESND